MNVLSMTERNKIIGLLSMGWTQRQIERETGHRRETIARVGREAGLLSPKCTTSGEVPTDSKAAKVATDSGRSRSSCEPYRGVIEAELAKGCHGVSIYQHLVDHHGYEGAYNAVKRFVGKLRPSEPEVKCRFETPPGQEAQVDYGEGAPTRHPRSGNYRRPRLFVMTLGMSRRYFPTTVWNSSKQIWSELHEEAFAYFGGATQIVRLDNLKEGVFSADVYDPEINELYAAMLAHYGVIAFPCRPYTPDLKGKVESGIHHVQRALKGKRFESTDEQNAWLLRWNESWASTRIHGTTKRQVQAMFEEERPNLLPLPPTRFEYYQIAERRVHLDGHIEVQAAFYSVPPRYVGTKVVVHIGRLWLRILDPQTHQLIREHAIAGRGQRRTIAADLPKQTPRKVLDLVATIAEFGPHCGIFARAVENQRGALAARTLLGVLDLIRRHGPQNVERACALAVAAGAWRFRFLRTYLAHHQPSSLTNEHRIIPLIDTYQRHFTTLAQGDSHDN